MEGSIRVDAGGMDRKYFYAFVKGLANIKYKDYFSKSKDFEIDESLDLQFLYSNLFNNKETTLDCMSYFSSHALIEFNKLVESTLNVIETIVQNNMSKDDLEEFLTTVRQALTKVFDSKCKLETTTRDR